MGGGDEDGAAVVLAVADAAVLLVGDLIMTHPPSSSSSSSCTSPSCDPTLLRVLAHMLVHMLVVNHKPQAHVIMIHIAFTSFDRVLTQFLCEAAIWPICHSNSSQWRRVGWR